MNSAITIDSSETRRAERDRPDERAADEQEHDAGRARRRANGVSSDAVGVEPAACRSDRRCRGRAGTRRSCSRRTRRSPRTRTRARGRRPAARGSSGAGRRRRRGTRRTRTPSWSSGEGAGRRGDQPDARRHLRREGADEERRRAARATSSRHDRSTQIAVAGRCRSAARRLSVSSASRSIIAGTISNRSPTMP